MGKVVVVGSSNTDLVVQTPHLPKPGETVLGSAFQQFAGGKGANQAVAARRAGGSVAFIGCLGTDAMGDQALAGFIAEGIDVSSVTMVPGVHSGIALIMVDDMGENVIAVASGANAHLLPTEIEVASAKFDEADVVLVQLEIPIEAVEAAIKMAGRAGKTVILNPAPARELPESVWSSISILTPNRSEAEFLAGMRLRDRDDVVSVARALLQKGVGAIVMTLGADGAYVATKDSYEWISGLPVDPVDTTGAGDVFNGALAAALSDGQSLVDAARFANAAAAISVTRAGAQASAPYRDEAVRFG